MRARLIGWLNEVHRHFEFSPETLFQTVRIIDLFASKKPIRRSEYQLVGVVAMHIASKYHEISSGVIEDYVHITDNSCTKDKIRAKEVEILTEIEFELNYPSARFFLDRFIVMQDQ